MNDTERDEKIIEMYADLKWIRLWLEEHKKQHDSYLFYFITLCVGVVASFITSIRK